MKNKINCIVFIVVLLMVVFDIYKCPFRYIFGISCPTCGLTRAIRYALQFKFDVAFYYHLFWPFVMAGIVFFILFLFGCIKVNRNVILLLCGLSVLNLIYYFCRLFSGSFIVNICFTDSLIYKIYIFLFH